MPLIRDPWLELRSSTRARIGLGRIGDALPLSELLDFQLAHARARDAVFSPLDVVAIREGVGHAKVVRSDAVDRATYLRRPDLGRRLHADSRTDIVAQPGGLDGFDAVFVLADGLSPTAVQKHAIPLLDACRSRLGDWNLAPTVIATQARVALGDEIGSLMGASFSVVFIGERPGLSVVDSLGIYITYAPRIGRPDSERNCISNIHADGLSYDRAADMLAWLLVEGRRRKLTGVGLKESPLIQIGPSINSEAEPR